MTKIQDLIKETEKEIEELPESLFGVKDRSIQIFVRCFELKIKLSTLKLCEEELNNQNSIWQGKIKELKNRFIGLNKMYSTFPAISCIEVVNEIFNSQVGETSRLVPEKERSNFLQKSDVRNKKPANVGNPERNTNGEEKK